MQRTIDYLSTGEGRWALTTVGGIIILIATVAYNIGHGFGEGACAFYTEYEKFRVQKSIETSIAASAKLNEAATKFAGLIDQTSGYQELKNENVELRQGNTALHDRVVELEEENGRLASRLKTLTPQGVISIRYGNSAEVLPGIIVGLDPINSDRVYMAVNGQREPKSVGETMELKRDDKVCIVTLRKVESLEGAVSAVCR